MVLAGELGCGWQSGTLGARAPLGDPPPETQLGGSLADLVANDGTFSLPVKL